MQKTTLRSSLILLTPIALLACATATGGAEGESEAAKSLEGSGGALLGSGGSISTGGASNGSNTGGGNSVTGGDCTGTASSPCSEHNALRPVGEAHCILGVWNLTECTLCEADESESCGARYPKTPQGSLTCDSTGGSWTESPETACTQCVEGVDTISCDDSANTGPKRGGEASCGKNGFDFSTCTDCEAGSDASIKCTELSEPENGRLYTGGSASCGDDGNWNQSRCEYCGDSKLGASEQCEEGNVPSKTCVELGLPVGDSGGAQLPCNAASCSFDTSSCSPCEIGVSASDCLDGPSASCTGSADCTGKQCGAGASCTMTCDTYKTACTELSCLASSCEIACPEGAACEYSCLSGSTCENSVEYQSAVDARCAAGSTCNITCSEQTTCAIACEVGANCSVTGTAYHASPSGTAHCTSGTCGYRFGGQQEVPLAIHCAAGATCDIISTTANTTVPNITCDKDAICNIDCAGDSCSCSGEGCPM